MEQDRQPERIQTQTDWIVSSVPRFCVLVRMRVSLILSDSCRWFSFAFEFTSKEHSAWYLVVLFPPRVWYFGTTMV